jgi:formylglycine-generating enzyme required for sulfatase activity
VLVAEGKLAEYQARALAAPVPVPLVLGPYVLDGWIAAGGMGNVFRATHGRMKRVVAVKVVHGGGPVRPQLLRRFQHEVEIAARLRHPNIVTAFDAGEQDGVAYLVTEFVDGEDLGRLVSRGGPLPVDRAVAVVRQAALGLGHAHEHGVVHRDVKPSNLMFGRDGVVRVLDVGLARAAPSAFDPGRTVPALTESGAVMGTADYMAPEQAQDARRADARSDVYALGCTLHYLLTGRPPYDGPGPFEVLLAHRRAPVPSLRAARPDVPAALDRLFGQMVAKAPEDRPPGMAAVLAGLDTAVRPPRRFPRRMLLAATGAAVLAGVAGVFAFGRKEQPPPPDGGPPAPPALPPLARIPFDARAEQRRWADALGLPVETENAAGMRLVLVPPGSFLMGSPDEEIRQLLRQATSDNDAAYVRAEAQREVVIPEPFYLSATEVTVGQFRRFVEDTRPRYVTLAEREGGWGWHPRDGWRRLKGCSWENADQLRLRDDHPVVNVTWHEAVAFCRWLTDRTGSVCRLPTEVEWEFACRAGGAGRWSFGDDEERLRRYAWTVRDSGGVPQPVATEKCPNALGLFDMHGNMLEWCLPPKLRTDRDRPPAARPGPWVDEYKPVRGGNFLARPDRTRSAARAWEHPNELGPGFRVLQVVTPRR